MNFFFVLTRNDLIVTPNRNLTHCDALKFGKEEKRFIRKVVSHKMDDFSCVFALPAFVCTLMSLHSLIGASKSDET